MLKQPPARNGEAATDARKNPRREIQEPEAICLPTFLIFQNLNNLTIFEVEGAVAPRRRLG